MKLGVYDTNKYMSNMTLVELNFGGIVQFNELTLVEMEVILYDTSKYMSLVVLYSLLSW